MFGSQEYNASVPLFGAGRDGLAEMVLSQKDFGS
jgi:hypothetical protein